MSKFKELPELPDLGPPPKSSADWFFIRRPGRSLDAAQVRLINKEEMEEKPAEDMLVRWYQLAKRMFGPPPIIVEQPSIIPEIIEERSPQGGAPQELQL